MFIPSEDRPMTGGAGWMPLKPVTVDQVLEVLAQKVSCDVNGHDYHYWTRKLNQSDFFTTLTQSHQEQLLFALMQNSSLFVKQVKSYLEYSIEEIVP